MKNIGKKILSYILVYIGLTLLFCSIMIGTYWLPNTNIRGHVAESVAQLEKESTGYAPFFQQIGSILDTHTDALILNIALNKGYDEQDSNIKKAFDNSFYEDETGEAVTSLQKNLQDGNNNNHEYSRYWHGMQALIRPLLLFFNYMEIRYILMMIIFILLGIVFSMIGKQLGIRHSIAFAITITMMFIIMIPMSIQYSSIFIVTLVAMIATMLLYRHQKKKFIPMLFFIIGAFSTFFDLLTYPLIALGLPLVLAVLLESREKEMKLWQQILWIIKLGMLWAIGYGLLFFTKWMVASVVLQKNAIMLAINEVFFRVSGNDSNPVDYLDMLRSNIDYFFVPTAIYILRTIAVIWLFVALFFRKKITKCSYMITLLCVAVIPYLWYLVFAGHSYIHCWFTYKIQAITVFAILTAMFEMIEKEKIKNTTDKIKEKVVNVIKIGKKGEKK